MKNDIVSLIIPVYNIENYLESCLESITRQTYHNLEIILINDGSEDSSKSICERYAAIDQRIIFINKDNEGLSKTRQLGFDKANGEYICTIDSDDYIELNFVDKLVSKIKKDKS